MVKLSAKAHVEPALAINGIEVCGYKSIVDEQKIEIKPLTILAGANSSGKSSIMQPLLLLKQTLEASYDPGTLLLNGPNLKFTSAEQLLSRSGKAHSSDNFHVGIGLGSGGLLKIVFRKENKNLFRIEEMELYLPDRSEPIAFWPEMTSAEIVKALKEFGSPESVEVEIPWKIQVMRCFLELAALPTPSSPRSGHATIAANWQLRIAKVIHLPGLRGHPERNYPITAVGPNFPGTFENYSASIISQWVAEGDDRLAKLNSDLQFLGLTGGVTAVPLNGAQVELFVGRLSDMSPDRPQDRVNVADVGVGVSQTLPILVALHAAEPGRLVYIEQPETHLHPRAQFALAQVLAAAANRGVRVVIEIHSTLLLLGVQALVAEGKLEPDKVKLHWFRRDKHGRTNVESGDLDEAGRFGNWPQDFDDVTLNAEKAYLDAADTRLFAK